MPNKNWCPKHCYKYHLENVPPTKGDQNKTIMKSRSNVKNSLVNVGKHLGSGVLGMVAGSYVGRHSLVIGALTIFGGAYYDKDWVTSAGVGMAFSGMSSSKKEAATQGIDGITDEMELAKDRAFTSLKTLGKKLYLDKFSPMMAQKLSLGELENRPLVFVGSQMADQGDFDTSEVDEIIRKIEAGTPLPTADISGRLYGDDTSDIGNIDILDLNGAEDINVLNAIA